MGAGLRTLLNSSEEQTLFELRTATTVPQRVKDRAAMIRLSHQGMYVEKIAALFQYNVRTVRQTLHRWQQKGLGGLWDAPHPGAQRRWHPEDMECLHQEERTYK
ncbi:transposase, putative (plasmid) [Acaryochloris marina MBIC11017]|uniref:Transposase, putative n=1 Tax=Acaryochloris marina (strain MBIC 11017) TaxID=329726 RepID=A8ZMS4_ACAM1|nr:transposase, putative [Acaryochloris marina MBIC11017]